MEASWRSSFACMCPVRVKYVIIVILIFVAGTGESVVETKLFFALYVFSSYIFYCVILIYIVLFNLFLYTIHKLALTLFLVVYMYCLVLITSTGSFPLSRLNRIHGW